MGRPDTASIDLILLGALQCSPPPHSPLPPTPLHQFLNHWYDSTGKSEDRPLLSVALYVDILPLDHRCAPPPPHPPPGQKKKNHNIKEKTFSSGQGLHPTAPGNITVIMPRNSCFPRICTSGGFPFVIH